MKPVNAATITRAVWRLGVSVILIVTAILIATIFRVIQVLKLRRSIGRMKMANDYLTGIAASMRSAALARAGTPARHQFTNGAMVALLYDGGEFKLRITRQGVKPNEPKTIRAWDTECETFRRAYGVPDNSPRREDAIKDFYFRIYAFPVAIQSSLAVGASDEKSLF